jgi:hypothetical protein
MEERSKIAAELEDLHGKAIAAACSDVYTDEPATIGVALIYLDCGCVLLRGFDQSGDIVGDLKILATKDSCSIDHKERVDKFAKSAIYRSVFWKDAPDEFDRKYGNETRIDIARKLFPPQHEE